MTSRDFCYWLQGAIEFDAFNGLDPDKLEMLRKHLSMVFVHEIDPSFPKEQQSKLTEIHNTAAVMRC